MAAMKLMSATLLVAIAINLHSTDAAACQLPTAYAAAPANNQYTTMTSGQQTCTSACLSCGQAIGTDPITSSGSLAGTVMQTIGAEICPIITYSTPGAAGAAATANAAFTGITVVADATTFAARYTMASRQGVATTVAWQDTGGDTNVYTICPCVTTTTNTCRICGCADLGFPTAAPTSSPTTAPTVVSHSPTNSVSISDDSLNTGDIAGIVIGAVAGSFLFLLIGVLVGGMIGGGKSAGAAAPAGQL